MSASTGSLSSNILFIRLELEQVQPGNRVIRTVYRSVQNIDHHLAGGADHCPVQMSAEHLALVVPGAHVQVGVKFTVHGVDGAGQGNDLKAAAEGVGVVFLFLHFCLFCFFCSFSICLCLFCFQFDNFLVDGFQLCCHALECAMGSWQNITCFFERKAEPIRYDHGWGIVYIT